MQVNFHYYLQTPHWCTFTGKLDELRAKLKAHNLNLPIMSTETGFTSDPRFNSSNDTQSLYLAQSRSPPVRGCWRHRVGQRLQQRRHRVARIRKSGLLNVAGAPKPSHKAYKTAVDQIGQRPVVRALGQNDGISAPMRGYEFGSDAGHPGTLWALWAGGFQPERGELRLCPACP